MSLTPPFAPPFIRVVEHVDRRILGVFQLVDATTELPIVTPARIEVRGASLGSGAEIPFAEGTIEMGQTRSGFWAIKRAPFFDEYAATFENPPTPPELQNDALRLRIAVVNARPHYLPQEFRFDLPRDLVNRDIFRPVRVPLFRAPSAPVQDGWAILRVRVESAQHDPLGAVLVRVLRDGASANALPIGQGMSEWRDRLSGEALVAVPNIARFRAREEDGGEVITRVQEIQFEIVRDPVFSAAQNQFPDAARLVAGTANGLIKLRSDSAPGPALGVTRPLPVEISAGQELTVGLTTP
jgi:hypothetical protein